MSYLSLFTFFMLILVTADNLLQLFIGWEGVGLCSYLLINFWFTRIQANKSAIKAMVVNRVGDVGIAIGIFLAYYMFQSIDFHVINAITYLYQDFNIIFFNTSFHGLTLLGIFLFIGAVGKSAQIGLHTWLPDAMEGPTPVSALIHAATMVNCCHFLTKVKNFILRYMRETPDLQKFLYLLNDYYFLVTTLFKMDNPQETNRNLLGSSETTCEEISLNYNYTYIDSDFKSWLIGFTEGDGSFVIPNQKPPQFEITQHLRDIDVLYKIKSYFGFGSIIKRPLRGVAVYQVIGNKNSLIKLAYFFNGQLRCPRRLQQFENWLSHLNSYYSLNISFINHVLPVSLSDSWLSGFSDAEASFEVRFKDCNTSKLRKQLVLRYCLTQKTPEILEKIKLELKLNNQVCFDSSWNGYRIITESLQKHKILIRYFNRYPLKTKKKINYLKFSNLLKDKINKLHLTESGLLSINKKLRKFKV